MRLNKSITSFGMDERGAALLEMAVVFPVLLTISLGVIEFGNAIYSQHLIFNGVRDASRYVAGLAQVDSAGNSLVSANDTSAKNIAVWGTTTNTTSDTCTSGSTSAMKLSRRVSWWCNASNVTIGYASITNDNGAGAKLYRGGTTIQTVTVTATVPYQQLGFLSYLGLTAPTLNVSHMERVYGVR